MSRRFQMIFVSIFCFCLLLLIPTSAHSGGTDSSGGHTDHSTGEYHYHHGYSAHQHIDGVCPYNGAVYSYTGSSSQQNTKARINELLDTEKQYEELQERYETATSQRDAYDEERKELKKSVEKLEANVDDLEEKIDQIKQEKSKAQSKNVWYFWSEVGAIILIIIVADAKSGGMKRKLTQVSNSLEQAEAGRKAAEAARDRACLERDNAARQRTNALLELNGLAKQWAALEHRKQQALQAGEPVPEPEPQEIDTSNISCREMARVPDDILFDNDYWPLIVNGESAIVYVNKAGTRYHKRECRCAVGATAENVYRVRPECEPCRFCEPIVVQGKPGWLTDYQSFIKKKAENGVPDPDIPPPKN